MYHSLNIHSLIERYFGFGDFEYPFGAWYVPGVYEYDRRVFYPKSHGAYQLLACAYLGVFG